jgi:hypothetical protein
MISSVTSAFQKEFIYFFNFLDNCLRNKNNNLLNYTLTLSSLIIFFSIFLIIYGLKLRIYSPIFEDDFHMLSLNYTDIEQILNSARPVGYVFVALSSFMPDSLIYISIFILTIINISLPIFILSVFLNIKKNQFFLYLLFASFITCSFYEYFVSLKHIRVSGLFSSLFFYLNVLIFFIIFKIKNNFLIIFYFILSLIFLLCSFFSKEDFILSNILMFIIFILYAFKKRKKIIFYSSFSILIFVIFFWIYINLAIYENPFILDGKGIDDNYQKNLSLFSIIFSYGVYLFYFTPTAFYSFYFFLLLIVLRKDINNIKSSIVFITFILLIIFPFSLLHKKFITEYIMQWFPILSSLIAFYLSLIILNKKFNKKLVLGLLSILFLIILNASIISKSELISLNEKLYKSYNYISGIKENMQIIKKNKLVKIDLQGDGGVPNPWYRQTGTWFERELNLNNKWYVFTDTKSKIYAVKNDFHYDEIKHNSKILILARSEINNYEGVTLKFDPQGNLIEIVE